MTGKIFINRRRRGDDPDYAQALYQRLESEFAADVLFMDTDNIPAGHDFVRAADRFHPRTSRSGIT
jgi:hypothetical protein